MKNFKSFYKNRKKKTKKREEDSESQLNDPYTDADLSTKPPPFNRRKTYLYPPNYGMGEGQRLVPKQNNLT
jgi:hypothetical protein